MPVDSTLPRLLRSPRTAHLVLSDGTIFAGWAAGARTVVEGEVVFNTSMTGYQEMLTDPSYAGQILTLTTSHVGQYGTCGLDAESDRVWAQALIVQELDAKASSWRSEASLEDFLVERDVAVGWGFDTRAIVQHVRQAGAVPGLLITDGSKPEDLLVRAQATRGTDGKDLAHVVACREVYDWTEGPWVSPSIEQPVRAEPRLRVAVIDYGVKRSIPRRLVADGFDVRVMPPDTAPGDILDGSFAGVVLSNGPGDPAAVVGARELITSLIGKLPVLGICLGHQLLGLALGGRTVKLPFGHHGGNHPVRELATNNVLVTSQNHNYAVEEASLPREVDLTHINLTDYTVEGLTLPRLGIEALQFHPEAAPGPNDAFGVFSRFAERCRGGLE